MLLRKNIVSVIFAVAGFFAPSLAFSADKAEKYIPDIAASSTGMTLWQIITSGGEMMFVLALISVAALALIIYFFFTLKQKKLVPEAFLNKIVFMIEGKKYDDAIRFCEINPNLIADIAWAGLTRRKQGRAVIEEAMKDKGERSITAWWHKLSYLADITAIAPMAGLLGTVLGMMQAFNVIAFQPGGVKPVLLANGISKAMVTTAAGLIIAIPCMIFYAYFRGTMQSITAQFENIATELLALIAGEKEK